MTTMAAAVEVAEEDIGNSKWNNLQRKLWLLGCHSGKRRNSNVPILRI